MKKKRTIPTASMTTVLLVAVLYLCITACGLLGPGLRPEPSVQPEPDQEEVRITLLAVGDINLGRKAGQIILDGDIDYAFEFVSDIISSADIAFGNLESTISDQGGETKRGVWRFPESTSS